MRCPLRTGQTDPSFKESRQDDEQSASKAHQNREDIWSSQKNVRANQRKRARCFRHPQNRTRQWSQRDQRGDLSSCFHFRGQKDWRGQQLKERNELLQGSDNNATTARMSSSIRAQMKKAGGMVEELNNLYEADKAKVEAKREKVHHLLTSGSLSNILASIFCHFSSRTRSKDG